ncbi:EndoU domain-containing protein [Tenacibaculum sp. M341]|uniref:EndoU domain-containing protein n=1 Tax=Tenacibaculum sp. M341 TaxID=2530339 RepID=UPI0014053057|nr:EndoU domain-containing protein [Tenacibaculum sp. M341]
MKTYINQIIKLCFLVLCISVNAQRYPVQVTQTVLPPYSSKLSDYTTATNVKLRLDVLLTDVVASNRQVRLKLRIKGNGLNIQSRDVVSGAPQIFLNGGVLQQLTNLDLGAYFQLNNLVGINPEQYNKPLPEGMYSICWEVYDVITNQQINNPATGCSDIFLILNDPPFLNLPFKGDQLVAKDPMNIIFQWTPRHVNATNVSYDFELREIWDRNIDPQAAFLASPNYYTETINTTTLLYDISKPVLLPKKLYAWRVKAKSITGISENSVFKNDGYSEIYYFTYTNRCDAPSFILSEALNSSGVKITWQGSFDHKKYHVQYKREDIPDAEWFDVYTYNNQAQISNLKQGETYVFRVGGTCNELNDFQQAYTYSSISQFTMPRKDEVATYNCGIIPEIEIKNLEPLKNIGVNESFTAGDFPITVKQVQGGNGVFTGTGFIVVPYLADTKIAVTFSSVKINEDYQLTDGVIRTTYDPTWGGVSDVNDVFVSGDGDLPSNTVDFVIEDIQVDPNGDIIVIGTNGEIVELPGGEGQVITDANGQTWTVDAEGNVTETGEAAEGGASNSENTNGVNNQGEATAITAKGVIVTFENADDNKYGFDTYEKSDKVTKDLYKKLNDDYFIPYKAVAHGTTERIIAKLDITDAKIKPSDIVFKTKDGIALTKVDSTATSYTFELKGTLTDNSVETQAVIKQGDKYEVAGAFIQYQAKIKAVDIVLVNTSNSNTNKIKETLQRIYQQALVQLNIKEINDFTNDLERLVSDDTIESGESEFLSQYTEQQKAINGALKVRNDFNKKAYYLILTNKKPSKGGEEGFMPLGKQFGYLFMNSGANERTIAHELGHGAFQLKHPFSSKSYGYEEKATSWLLDYGKGEKIPYVHWKEIHNPKLRLGIFDKDEEGEHYARPGLFSSLKFGTNSDKTFTFITPSGQYIVLPNEVADVSRFYGYYGTSGEMDKTKFNQFLNIVPGTLRKFTIDKRVFTAKFETSDDSTILTGYFDEKGKAYNSKDFGIDLEKTYAENKKSILYALGKKDNTLSYYVYCINGEKVALKPYQEQSLVTDITEFPVQSISSNLINDVKKVNFATKGGQQSITAESIKWAFTKYNSTEDQILRNKMAELKSLYPRFMQEITRRYADWNDEGKLCIGSLSSNFDSYIRDLFCDSTQSSVPISTPGLNSTITNYIRNSTKLPANSFEWQKLFYNYVKDNLFKLREELSASILAYNANPDLIDEHNRSKIARVSNLAAEDDIKQLRSDVIIQLLSKIVHNGLVTEGSVPGSDFEGAILNLLKKADKKNYKEILTGLEGRNYYSEKEEKSFLFKELYDGIHDFGTESKNALKLVSILTEMTLKSGDFYEQRSIETNNDLGERTFVLDYNNFVVATGKSILYGNVFFQIADEASNNYLENSLETYDISYDWLKDENKISLEQFQEVGFIPTNSSKPKKLRPFDLINFINVSNLSGVKDLDRNVQGIQQSAKLTDVPLPAIVAMYGSDKAGQETIEQGISTTIDVASLLASGGAITAIKGLSSVNKMRKAFYMLDVASSGLSLTATAISDSEENRKYREVLNALSAITGLVSMGDAGIDVYDKIKKASTLSKRIEIAKNSVDLVKNLPEKKVVETVFETFNKLDEDELVKFLNKYPGQLENAVKITIKYLKDAVKTNKANKVDEAKKLLTTLGKAIAKNKSGFITRLGNNPKLASLKKELEILEAEEAGIIEKFAVDFKYLTDDGLEEFANDLDLITGWRVLQKLEAERAVKTDIDELTSVSEIIERGGGYKVWKASEAGKSDRLWNNIAINEGTGNKIELELFGGEKFNVGFVTVDKDVIGFDINLPPHLQKQGLGTKIVEEAIKTFKPKRIEVSWAVDPKAYENGAALSYNKYRELEKTISDKHEVALATPGGRVMKKFGYDKVVELKDNGKNIYVLFETSKEFKPLYKNVVVKTFPQGSAYPDDFIDIKIDELTTVHPAPRKSQQNGVEKYKEMFSTEGFKVVDAEDGINPVRVIKLPDGTNIVQDGMHRVEAMKQLEESHIPVLFTTYESLVESYKKGMGIGILENVYRVLHIGKRTGYYKGTWMPNIPDMKKASRNEILEDINDFMNKEFPDLADSPEGLLASLKEVLSTDQLKDLFEKKFKGDLKALKKFAKKIDLLDEWAIKNANSVFQMKHEVLTNVPGRSGEYIVIHEASGKELCSGSFVDKINTVEAEFSLQTKFDNTPYASGKVVRQAVIDEMSGGDINKIDALRSEWFSVKDLDDNMKDFQKAIDKGLSIEEAIFTTKAGQWNKELGFDKVEVLGKSVNSSNQYRSIKLRFVRSTSKASHVPVNEVRKKVKNVSQHILGIAHSKGNFKKASVTVHGKKFDLEGFKGPHTEKALKDYVERNGGSYAIEKIEVDENGVFKGVPILYAHDKEFVKVTGNNFKYHKGVGNTKVGGESSFFPVDMTDEEILENVIHAVNNNKGYIKRADGTLSSDLLYGFSKDGKIEIRFKLKPDGTIGTYYPVTKKGKLEKLPSIRSFVHSNDVKNILKGILEANEGAFPKNIDLLGYKLGTKDDGIIDIIVHSNDKGEFLMNVEGETKIASAFILAKVIEELPDGQKIRLLSCNSEEVAIKISELTNKEFYASHGSVKLYEDGTIVHETPFRKYHKGARSDLGEIPSNIKEGTGDYIELGLFGGKKTLKEQVEAATLYFDPWSYHDFIRLMYADASMKQDYEALSKMFGIYKDFKGKNIGKTNKDYSKDFQPWPNKLKGSDDRVKYLKTAEERKPYEVSVKNGVLYTNGKELSKTKGFLDGEIIFIMDKDGSIYAGIGRPGFFHHSSFLDGGDIITGGEFRFINKKTLEIRPKSGHYSPSLDSLKAVIEELASRGFDIRNMKINPDVR